jgi:hypothetical protein
VSSRQDVLKRVEGRTEGAEGDDDPADPRHAAPVPCSGEVPRRGKREREKGAVGEQVAEVDPERLARGVTTLVAPFGEDLVGALLAAGQLEGDDPRPAGVLHALIGGGHGEEQQQSRDSRCDQTPPARHARIITRFPQPISRTFDFEGLQLPLRGALA